MTLEGIKEAIEHLPEQEQLALESWLAERWDAQLERDFSPGGPGMALLEEADAEIASGQVRPLHEVLLGQKGVPRDNP
jgi:hypothetical protein